MKFFKTYQPSLFALAVVIIFVCGWLILADNATQADTDTPQTLAAQLGEAEQMLQEQREELSVLLRDYYQGRAGEAETARLIEQTEQSRLRVEELRQQLGDVNTPGGDAPR